jgi:thiosulfate/3-mercaptopyruvate sulfurtransferase
MLKQMGRTTLLAAAILAGHDLAAQGASGGAPSLLVTPTQLARELQDPSLVLLYIGPREDYDAGHIAGARFVSFDDVVVDDSVAKKVYDLPDEADLRKRLERFGIGDDSKVVVIPGADWGSPATRVVWTLQVAGLGSRTRLLDGGSRGWVRAGLPVTKDAPPAPKPGRLTLAQDRSIVVDADWVQARAGSPGVKLIDGRAPVFYEGPGMKRNGMTHAAGHIRGAANIPFNTLMDDSLHLLPIEQVRKKFADAGVQPGDTVVAYCHIGQQATMVLFNARLLGHPIKLYDGSMADWEARNLPVENATAPKSPGGAARGRP